jgi:hypothetical protein
VTNFGAHEGFALFQIIFQFVMQTNLLLHFIQEVSDYNPYLLCLDYQHYLITNEGIATNQIAT